MLTTPAAFAAPEAANGPRQRRVLLAPQRPLQVQPRCCYHWWRGCWRCRHGDGCRLATAVGVATLAVVAANDSGDAVLITPQPPRPLHANTALTREIKVK